MCLAFNIIVWGNMVTAIFILAQLVGFLSLILYCISMQINNRMRLLVFLVFVNLLNAIVYFLLGSHAGGLVSLVSVTRLIIFSVYEKNSKACPLWLLILFITLDIIVGTLTFDYWYDILCILEAIIVTYGTYIKNMTITRVCHLFSCMLMFTFNIFVLAYSNMLSESIGLVFTLLGILRLDILPKISPEIYANNKILATLASTEKNKNSYLNKIKQKVVTLYKNLKLELKTNRQGQKTNNKLQKNRYYICKESNITKSNNNNNIDTSIPQIKNIKRD